MKSVVGQFFKNIAVTYLGTVVGLVITFFFTPYLIGMLDKERYGIWQLAFSVLAYMGLVDLGMKQSIVRYYSKFYAVKDWKQLNEVFSSAVRVYAFIGVMVVLISVGIVYGLLGRFQISPEFYEIAQVTILILGLDQAIAYVLVPHTAVGGFHRFDISNYYRVGARVIQTLAMIVLLEMGLGLIAMAFVVVGVNVARLTAINLYRSRNFPEVTFSKGAISREKTKLLFDYGIFSFLIVATWIVIFQTDNVVIGWFISMEAVALYSVAGAVITQIRGAVNIIAVPLVPTISHLEAEGNFEKIQQIYSKGTRYLYYLSTYIAIGTVTFGGPFILLWLNEDFTPTIEILQILIVAGAVFYPQMISNSILLGISKHKVAFYVLAVEAISKIALAILLVKPYGIVGVAYGGAIPQVIIYALVYPYVFHRVIRGNVKKFYAGAARSISLGIIIMLPVALVVRKLIIPGSWANLVIDCAIVSVAMMFGMYRYILEPGDKERIARKFHELRAKMGF